MARLPIDPLELDRELVRKGGLYKFLELGWHVIESEPFVPGWHLEEVCTHLEAVSRGEIRRLIINIPPGTGKSLTVCVFWPVWDWLTNPWRKWIFASFDIGLSQRDALRSKELIQSDWFQERWGFKADVKRLERRGIQPLGVLTDASERQNSATIFWTPAKGLRFSTSQGGKATGWHCHIQVIDDPTKPLEVQAGGKAARTALQKTSAWYKNTMASRKANPDSFSRVIIMQRLHEDDLAGELLRDGGYVHLRLPMRFETKSECYCPSCQGGPCRTPWGGDRRTVEGELLAPNRFSAEAVAETERDMTPRVAAAQLQQRPTKEGGNIFQRAWFSKRWKVLPAGIQLIQSWDCAFKDESDSDFVVGQVWGRAFLVDEETGKKLPGAEFFLVDEVRDRMGLPETCQAMKDLSRKWPQARLKLVEDKANGPAVEQTLRKKVPGIVLVTPQGGKVARANAVSPYFEAGNVWLPDEAWVEDYILELTGFPVARYDDRVDTTSQALLRLSGKYRPPLREAMDRILRAES